MFSSVLGWPIRTPSLVNLMREQINQELETVERILSTAQMLRPLRTTSVNVQSPLAGFRGSSGPPGSRSRHLEIKSLLLFPMS